MNWGQITTKNWHRDHILFEIPILKAFILGVEANVAESIKSFERNVKTVATIEIPSEGISQPVRGLSGLNDTTYDLDGIFKEYFPQLQRQTALITLYSFLERELRSLCLAFQKELSSKIKLDDLNKSGSDLERYFLYLTKVATLNLEKSDKQWQTVDHGIRIVRNSLVHSNARMPEATTKDYGKLQNHFAASNKIGKSLEDDSGSIVLHPDYLTFVLACFIELFKYVDAKIQAQTT